MKLKKYQKDKFDDLLRDMAGLRTDYKIAETEKFKEDFGFDSLDHFEFIMNVEKQFEINIPDEKVQSVKTVKDAYVLLKTLL